MNSQLHTVPSRQIQAGDQLILSWGALSAHGGHHLEIEVLGFTDHTSAHGDGPIVFRSAAELLTAYGARGLGDLQSKAGAVGKGYGYAPHLLVRSKGTAPTSCTKALAPAGEQIALYLYEGRWSIGSGAERVHFLRREAA